MKSPESTLYEKGLCYWPYKSSLEEVLSLIRKHAPQNGSLLDIMCGPGYLLGQIAKKRSDLKLKGVDLESQYMLHGKVSYPGVTFEQGNVLNWQSTSRFDVVVCTGAIHHVPYEQQEAAIVNIARLVKADGFAIISDCYVGDYTGEIERKLAAAQLGYEYLIETIRNGAPDEVVGQTVEILSNDVLMYEYKMSLAKRLPILEQCFPKVVTIKSWPAADSEYGDYVHICSIG